MTTKKSFHISGMSCNGCKKHVEQALSSLEAVQSVEVDLENQLASVTMDHDLPIEDLKKTLGESLYELHPEAQAASHKQLAPLPAIGRPKDNAGVYYCPMQCEGEKTYKKPGDCPVCGMDLVPLLTKHTDQEDMSYLQLLRKFRIAVGFTLPIFVIAMSEMIPGVDLTRLMSVQYWNWVQMLLSLPVVFYATWMFFERAYNSLISGNYNMFTLIGIGAGIAWLFSLIGLLVPDIMPDQFKTASGSAHLYFESATVILALVLLGQVLEARAHHRTSDAIKLLLQLAPNSAIKIEDGNDSTIATEEIKSGHILRVRPGDKVPVDGIILEGQAVVDESMISGEPIPVEKKPGMSVIAGTINAQFSFVMEAKKVGSATLLGQIIAMVNAASRSRAPIQKLADKISGYFVPAVIGIALLTFVIWLIFGPEPKWILAIVNAIAVLIIACPCALGLATPMSVMVGVGKGAAHGILLKDAESLQKMNEVDTLIIDKTGTITEGRPTVEQMVSLQSDELRLIQLVASVNQHSAHPLAEATVTYAKEKEIECTTVDQFESVAGQGVKAMVADNGVIIGNALLMKQEGIEIKANLIEKAKTEQARGKTISFVAIDRQMAGMVIWSDQIKPTSELAIRALQDAGVEVVMMTGDNVLTAQYVAETLRMKDFVADCLPDEKMNKVKQLQAKGHVVAMAGDGINDAPALAQADIGIAMGNGNDVAIESASVALVKGDLSKIIQAKKLSQLVMRNIRQNLFFALIYNGLGVPVAAGILYPFFGVLLSPMIAALAMSFSSVSVITNALRLKVKKLN